MRRALLSACLVFAVFVTPGAGASDPENEGLRAYVAGRFDEAAVGLKQSIREHQREAEAKKEKAPAISGQTAYFAGRSFVELGLRGLALHYLAQAELYGSPQWQLLARRELARAYFEATDYPAVMQVVDRIGAGGDPEVDYYAGLSAAELRAWPQAIEMLGRVPASSGYYGYALYARAQARAASEDYPGALADLATVIAKAPATGEPRKLLLLFTLSSGRPAALIEQAYVLRGKILYIQGKNAEAKAAFAKVSGEGGMGLSAARGLLLTGAGADAASKVEVPAYRAVDAAALLAVRAMAAEEKGEWDNARKLRGEVRDLVRTRLTSLDRLSSSPAAAEALEGDLSSFWQSLRQARWQQRWQEEQEALSKDTGSVGSPPPLSDAPFRPTEALFYGVWDQQRSNEWLHGLIGLRGAADQLARDIEVAPKRRSFWKFWRADDDLRLADALLVVRLVNLEQRLADHLHNFAGLTEDAFRDRKKHAVDQGNTLLLHLYTGEKYKFSEQLNWLDKTIEYKRYDIFRLVEQVPEKATDPVVSLLGNYVDLLADMRAKLADEGQTMPKASTESPATLGALRTGVRALTAELSDYIRKAIEPTRRAQVVFFTRVEADNEGSFSRLYGKVGRPEPKEKGDGDAETRRGDKPAAKEPAREEGGE